MKFLLTIAISLGIGLAQAPTSPTPQTTSGLAFAAAYYQAQNPIKAPLYNGRPGSANPTAPQLSQTAFNSLISQILATPGVLLDEQIDDWGWDPLTTMQQRLLSGIGWVPSGLGSANCLSILTSGCVITQGQYSGTPPAGTIPTCVSVSCEVPWPVTAPPTTPVTPMVGPSVFGPYYEVLQTPAPPIGTQATGPFPQGTKGCVLQQIVSQFMIGASVMNVWNCQ